MLQSRSKPVNIRVTETEFRTLRDACQKIGTRNVSELARNAMNYIIETNRPSSVSDQDLITCLNDLEGRLANLQAEIARMKAVLKPEDLPV